MIAKNCIMSTSQGKILSPRIKLQSMIYKDFELEQMTITLCQYISLSVVKSVDHTGIWIQQSTEKLLSLNKCTLSYIKDA